MIKKWIVLGIVFVALASLAVASAQAGPPARQPSAPEAALGTTFTYQGQLNLDGQPVNNTCDLQFSLYDDALGNVQVGATQTITGVEVAVGLFTVPLDFGSSAFQGDARWLGIQVQCQGDAAYTDLGLQALTATPYALALPGLWTGQNATSPNLIGGYSGNSVGDGIVGATIGGGGRSDGPHQALGDYVTVGGGRANTASGYAATISGGLLNVASGGRAAIGGGLGNTASGESTTVSGGASNATDNNYSTVGGGYGNAASGNSATIGGGYGNAASGDYATVPGGYWNVAGGIGAFVGGGGYDGSTNDGNEALGNASTIGGGLGNVVTTTATYATIGGGKDNLVTPTYGTIAGGYQNVVTNNGTRATVGGGYYNTASGFAATVGGGWDNTASDSNATVGGGKNNTASWNCATVGGGWDNTASTFHATVGGGWDNTASGFAAAVGGGAHNIASGIGAFVGGGGQDGSTADSNEALSDASTIGGGLGNVVTTTSEYATIGGGRGNTASGGSATIGGGAFNVASDGTATVGGGQSNTASDTAATVGGGIENTANGYWATIGGGGYNVASDSIATVGGGQSNTASSGQATVGGGQSNTASGFAATIGGGYDNTASGEYASVPGGRSNAAGGDYSFAAGRRAQANHDGAIILADGNDFDFASLSANTFKVRATGGIRFVLGINGNGDMTWSCLVNDGNSWSCSSDRNLKENLDLVDGGEVLQRLAELPVYTWNGKGQDPALRHMGPMAQDFYAAFELGGDDTHIATIDLDGVALAAIQGLAAENATLRERVDDLETRLSALESGASASSPLQAGLLPGTGLFLVGGVGLWLAHRKHRAGFVEGEDGR